jgi:hypothetical protein
MSEAIPPASIPPAASSRDAFKILMAAAAAAPPPFAPPPTEPIVTGVLYCARLVHVPETEPLWNIRYYGQAVRVGEAEEVAKARWKREVHDAARENKQIGFLAVLDAFGADAFEWEIIASLKGRRDEVQELIDQGEIGLIAEAGGPLRDMNQRLDQTLNQTKGGKGDDWWASMDAFRKRVFSKFKIEMEAYVAEYSSSLVPVAYVNPLTKYMLGAHLDHFRHGIMREGCADKAAREAWAEALPGWSWSPHADARSQFRAEMEAYVAQHGTSLVPQVYVNPSTGYHLGKQLAKFRQGKLMGHLPGEEDATTWAEALPGWAWDARQTQQYIDSIRIAGEQQGMAQRAATDAKIAALPPEECAAAERAIAKSRRQDAARKKRKATGEVVTDATWKANLKAACNDSVYLEGLRRRVEKKGAAQRAATDAKIAALPPEERAAEEKRIARSRRKDAARKAKRDAARAAAGSSAAHAAAPNEGFESE